VVLADRTEGGEPGSDVVQEQRCEGVVGQVVGSDPAGLLDLGGGLNVRGDRRRPVEDVRDDREALLVRRGR
jgi:hypothetical protein